LKTKMEEKEDETLEEKLGPQFRRIVDREKIDR
jgi:hypothetical protein